MDNNENLQEKINTLERQLSELKEIYDKKLYVIEKYLWGKCNFDYPKDKELWDLYMAGDEGGLNPDKDNPNRIFPTNLSD